MVDGNSSKSLFEAGIGQFAANIQQFIPRNDMLLEMNIKLRSGNFRSYNRRDA